MSSTIFIARLLGIFTVVIALAILINRRGMIAALESLVRDSAALLIVEMIGLAGGLAIVLVHNQWHGGLLAIVITVLGWFILLRAVILMLLPPETIENLFKFVAWRQRAEVYALITLIIGLCITTGGFVG